MVLLVSRGQATHHNSTRGLVWMLWWQLSSICTLGNALMVAEGGALQGIDNGVSEMPDIDTRSMLLTISSNSR
jgi:hypothetical protein